MKIRSAKFIHLRVRNRRRCLFRLPANKNAPRRGRTEDLQRKLYKRKITESCFPTDDCNSGRAADKRVRRLSPEAIDFDFSNVYLPTMRYESVSSVFRVSVGATRQI